DAGEHRHRRRRGRRAPARRLGGRDRQPDRAGALPVPDRLLLDAAALLGAGAADQARLRGSGDPDAAGRPGRARDRPSDRPVLDRPGRRNRGAVRLGHARVRVPGRRARARRRLRMARGWARAADDAAPRRVALPHLAPLPRAAVRRGGARPDPLMIGPETQRKNLLWGWGLFVLFLLLLAGTVAVA